MPTSLHTVYVSFHVIMTELSSRDRDQMYPANPKILTVCPFSKTHLAALDLYHVHLLQPK